ncbi:hypothetical protein HU184_08705 [Escherichia coli]|nr:hypothetical protein [Escherichia coli]
MNNMATKELFKFLPKYKAHKNVSASKIKNVVIFGVTDAPLWAASNSLNQKGQQFVLTQCFYKNTDQKLADI